MENEVYKLIKNKIDELSKYGIVFPSEKLNSFYNEMINSGLSIKEIENRVDDAFSRAFKSKKDEILNEKAKNGEYSNFNSIKETATYLANSPLAKFITIYGGSVPYLITGETPKRVIGDIDLHASIDDMEIIRQIVKNDNNVKILVDTKDFSEDDYGMELRINDVDVSVFPTVLTDEGKIVKNFSYQPSRKKIIETATMFYGLTKENSTVVKEIDGNKINIEIPEYIYIQKSIALREKDRIDLAVLDKIVDQNKIEYLKRITKTPDKIVNKEILIDLEFEDRIKM